MKKTTEHYKTFQLTKMILLNYRKIMIYLKILIKKCVYYLFIKGININVRKWKKESFSKLLEFRLVKSLKRWLIKKLW